MLEMPCVVNRNRAAGSHRCLAFKSKIEGTRLEGEAGCASDSPPCVLNAVQLTEEEVFTLKHTRAIILGLRATRVKPSNCLNCLTKKVLEMAPSPH